MLSKVHHIGLVVRRLEQAYEFWRDTLGLHVHKEATVVDQGVRAALLPCGETEIELLEPINENGGVAKFLAKRGEGLHHLCFESDDVAHDLSDAEAKGLPMLDKAPRPGLAGMIGFLHPKASCGVLVEFATPPPGAAATASADMAFDHLAVVVDDVADACATFHRQFGLRNPPAGSATPEGAVPMPMSRSALHFYALGHAPARFGDARGLAGVGLRVAGLDGLVSRMRATGVDIDRGETPAVCHAQAHGVPIMLCEGTP
jgi:methylmalonyl-CoA/ethylmalonyl-CoA epimerase